MKYMHSTCVVFFVLFMFSPVFGENAKVCNEYILKPDEFNQWPKEIERVAGGYKLVLRKCHMFISDNRYVYVKYYTLDGKIYKIVEWEYNYRNEMCTLTEKMLEEL